MNTHVLTKLTMNNCCNFSLLGKYLLQINWVSSSSLIGFISQTRRWTMLMNSPRQRSECGVGAIYICGPCWGVGVSKQKPEELFVLNIVPSFWGLWSQRRSRNGLVRHKLSIYWSLIFSILLLSVGANPASQSQRWEAFPSLLERCWRNSEMVNLPERDQLRGSTSKALCTKHGGL